MNLKKIRYLMSAAAAATGFYLYLNLPYEIKYWGLMVGIVLVIFCFWFGLGIIFEKDFHLRMAAVLLPVELFSGLALFMVLLPLGYLSFLLASVLFGVVCYIIFLLENVFLVSVGYKTVPLYRAAYTVGLIILVLASFMVFDTLWSFKLPFWANFILAYGVGMIIFTYQFWAVAIELPDDGKSRKISAYVSIPALLVAELALVLSFWPVGIFRGSMYLVAAIYILCSLIQADIRERLFRKFWLQYLWIGMAVLVGMLWLTRWR